MFSYVLNGPLTLVVVLVGSLLNGCTIYVLSIYTISRYRRQQRTADGLKNIASILRANDSIKRRRNGREATAPGGIVNAPVRTLHGCDAQRSQAPATQCGSRPRIYTFLLWLSASDTALLASALLMYGIPALRQGHLESTYVQLTSTFYWISNAALIASVWLMCALTFDRYRTISQSFKRSKQSTGTINKTLCVVCTMAIAFALPRFFEIQTVYDTDSHEYYPVQTSLVQSQVYMVGYRILGGLLFYSLLPYVVLFLLSLKDLEHFLIRHEATRQFGLEPEQGSGANWVFQATVKALKVYADLTFNSVETGVTKVAVMDFNSLSENSALV